MTSLSFQGQKLSNLFMESFAKAVKLDLSAHILGKVGTFDSALLFESFLERK